MVVTLLKIPKEYRERLVSELFFVNVEGVVDLLRVSAFPASRFPSNRSPWFVVAQSHDRLFFTTVVVAFSHCRRPRLSLSVLALHGGMP